MIVAMIGLGAMGLPMATNLLHGGHDVIVASKSQAPIDAAVALGARHVADLSTMGSVAELIIICVPTTADVDQVVTDLLPGLRARNIVIDTSTIDPDAERENHRRVSETGARYLDGPLSGGTAGAIGGTLTVMVGGDDDVIETIRPVLAAIAANVISVGGPGMGQVVKLCNNLIYASQMVATAEAAALAVASGCDLIKLVEVLSVSTGNCTAVTTRFPVPGVIASSPASNGFAPGFQTNLMAKDLDLALSYADQQRVAVSMTALAREFHRAAQDNGSGREDFSALAKVVFRRSNLPTLEG